uniref:Uncharacterized protein n=1 Tax=Anguilla anguilla TaxID=7936 RepID=A0A0E9SQS5_ANGAN
MSSLMVLQSIQLSETSPTVGAVVWAFPCMSSLVFRQST